MRINRLLVLPAFLALAACAPDSDDSVAAVSQLTAPVFAATSDHFMAHPTGREEIPMNDSRAQGQAQFRLSDDGASLHYKLIVANIENVTQSHIHMAPRGTNGGIIVWLYPSAPPSQLIPGRSQGVLAEGDITAANLTGALAGMDLSDLVEQIRAGNTYVNGHTSQFPPGEIRGQVR